MNEQFIGLTEEDLREYVKVKAFEVRAVLCNVPDELIHHIFEAYRRMARIAKDQVIIDAPDLVKEVPEPEPITPTEENTSADQPSDPKSGEHNQGEGSTPPAGD